MVSIESSSLLPLVPLGDVAALPLASRPPTPLPRPFEDGCSGEEVAEEIDPPAEFSADEDDDSPLEDVAVEFRLRAE